MTRRKKDSSYWKEIYGGCAFIIPLAALRHDNLKRLSPYACKLLLDLGRQYSGFNNGYLCASWSLMRHQGWRSPTTLHRAMLELEHYRVIARTQQGGLNKPNLHGFTWRKINEKPGRPIDCGPSLAPSNDWQASRSEFMNLHDRKSGCGINEVCSSLREKRDC